MTNPQAENGHIDVNNENAEQFARLHLSGNEWQILWVVLRNTWGWHKKEDNISLSQFEEKTGLSRPSVKEAIDKLVGKKVLILRKEVFINTYAFNKVYSQWIVPKKELVGFSVTTSREKGTRVVGKKVLKLVPKKEHTKEKKEIYTKETIQKKGLSHSQRILSIPIEEKQTIAEKYGVTLAFVESKQDDLLNWHEQNPQKNKKENWIATLRGWVKRDALQVIERHSQNVQRLNKYGVTRVRDKYPTGK